MSEFMKLGLILFAVLSVLGIAMLVSKQASFDVPHQPFVNDYVVSDSGTTLKMIYTGKKTAGSIEPSNLEGARVRILAVREGGEEEEIVLSDEIEPYEEVSVPLPQDTTSFYIYYDDEVIDYTRIGNRSE